MFADEIQDPTLCDKRIRIARPAFERPIVSGCQAAQRTRTRSFMGKGNFDSYGSTILNTPKIRKSRLLVVISEVMPAAK